MKKLSFLLTAAIVGVVLAPALASAATREVSVGNFYFRDGATGQQGTITVREGDRLRFTVTEGNHSVDIDALGIHSERLRPGDTFTTGPLNAAGSYQLYCALHEGRHTARLVVDAVPPPTQQEPAPVAPPATQPAPPPDTTAAAPAGSTGGGAPADSTTSAPATAPGDSTQTSEPQEQAPAAAASDERIPEATYADILVPVGGEEPVVEVEAGSPAQPTAPEDASATADRSLRWLFWLLIAVAVTAAAGGYIAYRRERHRLPPDLAALTAIEDPPLAAEPSDADAWTAASAEEPEPAQA